jgi:flagellar hook-associated protein 1 FlgK
MKSTFSGLNTLVRGLYAQQLSLDTIGHNISNASTEGYSRQRVNLSTTRPESIAGGVNVMQVGTGVATESVTRARDFFMDLQYWKENSSLGYGQASQGTLGKIEGIFHDDEDTGIQTVLNNFWNAWQTLSTNSSNDSARTAVRERGAELVDAIQHAATQLRDLVADVNATLDTKVTQINQITSEIYALNKQISNIEIGGFDHANDLRDRRDLLVDQLSKLTNVTVFEDKNKNYVIQTAGITLADGNGTTKLGLDSAMDAQYGFQVLRVTVAGSAPLQYVNFTNGEMKALQEANTVDAQAYLDDLATMSRFLLQEFNGVHRAGFGSDNSTGNNFFGRGGTPDPDYTVAADLTAMVGHAPPLTNGEWLKELTVNADLYNADGLSKVAAKTAEVKTVVQSNAAGPTAKVTGTYTPLAANPAANLKFQFTVTAAGIDYTVVDAATGLDPVTGLAPVPTSIAGGGPYALAGYGLTLTLSGAGAVAGDTYSFTVPQGNASGDNAVLLSNALKMPTTAASVLAGSSLDDYYESMIADLGVAAQNRERLAANQQTLVNQIENWRQSTAGVNIDEEMSNMIKFQKGYNAAARVVTTIDEMLDKLINGTGIVGR